MVLMLEIGSPPPTLACPHCPRHFYSKGGRTKHVRAMHGADGLVPQKSGLSSPSVLSSPVSPSSQHPPYQDSLREPSPTPPDSEQDEMLRYDFDQESSRGPLAGDDQHVPDSTRLTIRVSHPILDGASRF